MQWRKTVYGCHRWLALGVSLQLLAWSVGGFTFSILDIDDVHGDLERNSNPPPPIRTKEIELTPAAAIGRAVDSGVAAGDVASLAIRTRFDGRTVYELFDAAELPLVAVDARSGEVARRISEKEATVAALRDFAPQATVRSVRFLEGDPPLEYRTKPMPVYQVILDHPKNPHIYVSPVTGKIITRRNRPWRIFDFFWMLHIMDYSEREDFNHWLLTGMSLLAISTSTTGLALWGFRLPFRKRKRKSSDSSIETS